MKKHILPLLMLSLAILSFSCTTSSEHNPRGKTSQMSPILRINIVDDPSTLDPRMSKTPSDRTLMNVLCEGLSRVNKDDKVEPALAQVVEISSDLKTYTFYLRSARWTNGDMVKASDFVYAWRKVLDPKFPSDNAYQLYPIKNAKKIREGFLSSDQLGVTVVDDTTLKVELEEPTPYFLELTAFPVLFPVNEAVDRKNPQWAEKETTYVGCGPFKLVEWKHQNHIAVEKNDAYWDAGSVKLEKIDMCMVKAETELRMFEKKELDWAGSPLSNFPIDAIKGFKKEGFLKTKPMLGTYFFRINVESAPLHNVHLRRALAMAIDRGAIVDHVTQGNQIPATGLVPLSMGLQDKPYFQDHNIEEARRLFQQALDEMHVTPESFSEIALVYPATERSHLVAQAVQQQWKEVLGVTVKLESMEMKVYFDRVSHKQYQIAAGSWMADVNDPVNFLEVFKTKQFGNNNTGWENTSYAQLLDRSAKTADADLRKNLLKQSEDLLIKDMPIIPVFYYSMVYTSQDHVKDLVVSSMGNLDFKWAYLDSKQ